MRDDARNLMLEGEEDGAGTACCLAAVAAKLWGSEAAEEERSAEAGLSGLELRQEHVRAWGSGW